MKYSPFQDSFVVQSWFAVVVVQETRSCLHAIGYDYWTDQNINTKSKQFVAKDLNGNYRDEIKSSYGIPKNLSGLSD